MRNRLSKILAAAGVASRRACEEIIFSGRVKVNGQVVLLPQEQVDSENETITIDGKKLGTVENKVYFLLNKPKGYLCTNKRVGKKKLVIDLFSEIKQRLFTVGRLDKETTGLLLVTNDGHFANRVIHPSSDIQKEYIVKSTYAITDYHLKAIDQGTFVEGVFVKPYRVVKMRRGTLKVIVKEGKKHEVRKLVEQSGLDVLELSRVRLGGLRLGNLPIGSWRPLTEVEKEIIFE